MRRVAVVGAGIAGLLAAHGLRRAGYAVSLYSDRTPEQWLAGRPTGTALRFDPALSYERELGLDFWEAAAPKVLGAKLLFCPRPGKVLASLTGRQPEHGVAIDVRLQSHRWMQELEARGGQVVIESVTVDRLDAIAAEHDLTIVAAGKGEISELFPRDAGRSGFAAPQRHVAMITVTGAALERTDLPFSGVINYAIDKVGEAVWIPYFHRDIGPCWNLIFEAWPGGPMDVLHRARSGAEALALAQRIIGEVLPWEAAWARDMALADDDAWLVGRITPTVRGPVGQLPSGRIVTCLGDTAIHFDPLAAQGANNGSKMARHLVREVIARGDAPLDAGWMTATFEEFWAAEGEPAFALTNMLLGKPPLAGLLIMLAQYGYDPARPDGREALANRFASGVADPKRVLAMLTDTRVARAAIGEETGKWWLRAVARGALEIARDQLRHKFSRASGGSPAPQRQQRGEQDEVA